MVDKVSLNQNEVIIFDTATNIMTFLLLVGHVEILSSDDTVLATLNDNYEIYTLPANVGKVKVRGITDYSSICVFRSFYI